VSAHVLELLSAYLDDELVPADRTAIDLHLRDCPGCSRRLEEIAVLDGLARALPAEAPEGYFDDFSARVRAKLAAPAVRAPGRIPAWTLAAAATVLLAVLTPTLVRKQAATSPAAPSAAADSFTAATPAEPRPPTDLASEAPPPPTLALDTLADKKLARSRNAELQGYSGVEPDRAKEQGALAKQAPKDVREELALGYVAAPEERQTAESRDDAPAALPAPAGSRPQPALSDEAGPGPAAAASELRGGAFASGAEAKTAPSRRPNPAAAAPQISPFQELLDRRVSTAAEARSLREAWRAHAVSAPAAEADEARIRAIEAGALAAKLSRETSDLIQLRKDVADYLARADALQASRARSVLRAAQAAGR